MPQTKDAALAGSSQVKNPRFTRARVIFTASSGLTAPYAASDATARRHSVGLRPSLRLSTICVRSSGTQAAQSPRATATYRQTSDSRSARSRLYGIRTASPTKTRSACGSPICARRAASRAARSRIFAARRLAGSERVDGAPTHSRAYSRRLTSASASGPSAIPCAMGSSARSPTRARMAGDESPLPPVCAMIVTIAVNVSALPASIRARTRRPSSRCSDPTGSAAASE